MEHTNPSSEPYYASAAYVMSVNPSAAGFAAANNGTAQPQTQASPSTQSQPHPTIDYRSDASLHWDQWQDHTNLMRLLRGTGFDIQACDNNGNTLLHWAVWYGRTEV